VAAEITSGGGEIIKAGNGKVGVCNKVKLVSFMVTRQLYVGAQP
jgi:hypothetical protein